MYAYGQEKTEPEEGSLWAVNVFSAEHGFISWGEGEVLGEVMVPLAQPRPVINELPDTGQKWDEQFGFQLQCLDGEDKGLEVVYKGTSMGYKQMFNTIMQAVQNQLSAGSTEVIPVVTLDTDSYRHKAYGTVFKPQLNVHKWVAASEEAPEVDDIDPDETPKKSSRRKRA